MFPKSKMIRLLTLLPLLLLALYSPAVSAASPASVADDAEFRRHFAGYEAAFVLLDARTGTRTRFNAGRCGQRFSPCSTFKVLHTLIALETGAVPNLDHRLRWDGTPRPISTHNRDHTLRTAFAESAAWYYQWVAPRVGADRMACYLTALNYGNRNQSGGLSTFWLGSSLKISADEQVDFLHRLYRGDLPFSEQNQAAVRELMLAKSTSKGTLRGKTGTDGGLRDGVLTAALGWYVGWVETPGGAYIFAANISGGDNPTGRKTREIVEQILTHRGLL
jgi:beta-lactamase class D